MNWWGKENEDKMKDEDWNDGNTSTLFSFLLFNKGLFLKTKFFHSHIRIDEVLR